MPTEIVPLVGSMTARNTDPITTLSTKDQIFSGVLFDVIQNQVSGKLTLYANKRPGVKTGTTIAASKVGMAICENHGFDVLSGPCTVFTFGGLTDRQVFVSTTQVGTIGSVSLIHVCEITQAVIAGEEHYLIAYPGTSEGGFFVNETGMSGGTTFTGDTVSGNANITNVSSTTGLVVGQLLSGTGIQSGARISNISGTTVTMTLTASANGTGVTITRERMAKIIDADFPSQIIGPMIEMDGYIFVAEKNSQKIFQSDLNSVQSWSASAFASANATPGKLMGISRIGNDIVAITSDSTQHFYNSGAATGSVLQRIKDKTRRFGALGDAGSFGAGTIIYRPFSAVDDLLFVMHDDILMMTPEGGSIISNEIVSKLVRNVTKNTIRFEAFKMLGRPYLYVANSSFSLLYDVDARIWSYSGFSRQFRFSKHLGYCVHDNTDGTLNYWPFLTPSGTPVYQDNGSTYTMSIQLARLDFGTNARKFVSRIDLIGADIQSTGSATLEVSEDDFATYRTVGTFDLTKINPYITRCGSFQGGASFRLTHSANTAFRAQALKFTFEVGTS